MVDQRKRIVCVADAPGPAESLLPVISLLRKEAEVMVVGVGKAMRILGQVGAASCNAELDAERLYDFFHPDLLVAGISSLPKGPFVNNALIQRAAQNAVPVLCIQDFWGNHRAFHNKHILSQYRGVCVPDDLASRLWKEDGFTGEVHITGNPAFDRFQTIPTEPNRKKLRSFFGICPEDQVLLYAGQGTPSHLKHDKTTFALLALTLHEWGDQAPKLVIRPHPRAVQTDYYWNLASKLDVVGTTDAEFTEDVLSMADVAVSMFSTNLVHACLLRIPALSIFLPEVGAQALQSLGLPAFPPVSMGAVASVEKNDPAELRDTLEKLLFDKPTRTMIRTAQEKHFPLTGGAAARVANIGLSYVALPA